MDPIIAWPEWYTIELLRNISGSYFWSSTIIQERRGERKEIIHSACWPKLHLHSGQNCTIALFIKIYINLSQFQKYVGIYHFLGTRVWGTWVFHGTRVHGTWVPWKNFEIFLWYSSSIKKFSAILKAIFFKELNFMELELHGKLKFHKFEFQKGGRLLNISQIVVYCKIFCKRVVFSHFGLCIPMLYVGFRRRFHLDTLGVRTHWPLISAEVVCVDGYWYS